VGCPTTGTLTWTGPLTVRKTGGLGGGEPDYPLTIEWASTSWSDVVRGNLKDLRTLKTFKGTVLGCTLEDTLSSSAADGSVVVPGDALYFIGRGAACNVNPYHWNDGSASQVGNRTGQINSDTQKVCQ
jgi:hypothetical protein